MTAEALSGLKSLVGSAGWSDDPDVLEPRLVEWRDRWRGHTPLLVRPADVAEVARVVGYCAASGLSLTPQGGNTGLVGGQIPRGEVLLGLDRLRAIREVSPTDDAITVEAGVTLAQVQAAAAEVERRFPLSIASEGSATVGGAVSTNAGGVAVLRYGTMRDLVLGLEVVLPDGRIWDGLKRLRKDNTGYDLKQLFIGAEGTLGVVTAATLRLVHPPRGLATAMVSLPSAEAALQLLALAREHSGGQVEAFELMNRAGMALVLRNVPGVRPPPDPDASWWALLETAGGDEALEAILAAGLEQGLIGDAVVARSEAQAKALWKLRESHSAAQKPEGAVWKHDVSVPVARVAGFINAATAAVLARWPEARVVAFGHVGDGNIHFDVLQPQGAAPDEHVALRDAGSALVHDLVAAFEGSISAEHGLGSIKTAEAARLKPALDVELQRAIRGLLDPRRLLNPRVLF